MKFKIWYSIPIAVVFMTAAYLVINFDAEYQYSPIEPSSMQTNDPGQPTPVATIDATEVKSDIQESGDPSPNGTVINLQLEQAGAETRESFIPETRGIALVPVAGSYVTSADKNQQ